MSEAAPTLREFLDNWRLSRGWSIQRFADEVEVHQSLASKWLNPNPQRRVTPSARRLRKIAAGVEGVIPHRFRHLFATQYLVAHPGDEIGLRRILGHLSHEILTTYVHLSQRALAERMSTVSLSSGWLQAR